MLISVIVPVYNVERYLRRCVFFFMEQTYGEIEIILVDDGSSDRRGAICDELTEEDGRTRVVHKANGGVSSARNVGIDMANGEYLCFVDSDDWLNVDYFQKAVPVLKRIQPKLLRNNYVKEDGEGHVISKFSPSSDLHLDGNRAFYEAIGCKKIRFYENIIYGEDLYFRFQFTQVNDGLYVYQYLPVYHYFQRPDSAVNSYGIYKKVDDLEVLERCMTGAGEETRRVLLCRQYIQRLVRYCIQGIRSVGKRDELAGRMVRGKIWSGLGMFC